MSIIQKIATVSTRIAFAALLCASIACGDGSPTSPSSTPRDYTGTWTGTTTQGKTISFQVSGNTITTFNIGYVVQGRFANNFGSGSCTVEGTVSQQMTTSITANAFTFSGSTLSTLAGNFGSATSASGSITVTLSSASCAGTANTTWTATKGQAAS